jgi:tocopherol O-methyltransferase
VTQTVSAAQPLVPVSPRAVAAHYDRCSWLYARLWGEHLHHGYWTEEGLSPQEAQVRLTERVAAVVPQGAEVLDAGCGLGGSSVWLARERGCRVTGVTLSPAQVKMARARVGKAGLADRVSILHGDLEQISRPDRSLDVVWCIESTEHFQDKPRFFRRASDWLRPGGVVTVCAWTAAAAPDSPGHARYIEPICRNFFCPSLGSAAEYAGWMRQAGLEVVEQSDLTQQVWRTWEVCLERTNRFWVRALALLLGKGSLRFLNSFRLMRDGYLDGSLTYTLLVARKPPEAPGG